MAKLYQQLADDLIEQIRSGVFLAGEKLPSIRELSRQKKVSIATVQRALELLEDQQFAVPKAKSGYYVKSMQTQSKRVQNTSSLPLQTDAVQLHSLASQLFKNCDQPQIFNMGTAYPHAYYYPETQLKKIAQSVTNRSQHSWVDVHFSSGNPLLKQRLAKRLAQTGGAVSPEEIIVTNGCLEALSVCLRAVCNPGDYIALESPGFVGLYQLIEALGLKAIEIPCDVDTGLNIDALEMALEHWPIKAVAVVPSFSNPLGSLMPIDNRKRLVELATQHKLPIIEDELLAELAFDGSPLPPCKAFDREGWVLHCNSVSKTLASGLRIGWIVPGRFYKAVEYHKTFTNISPCNFSQWVVTEFLAGGRYDRHLRQVRLMLAKQIALVSQWIQEYFPHSVRLSQPQGGCVIWVQLDTKVSGMQLHQLALQKGLAVIPGTLCSGSEKYNHCIRINCACDPKQDLQHAIKTLGEIANQLTEDAHSS